MTKRARFTQTDITRALKGLMEAGFQPKRIEIDVDGKISVSLADEPTETPYARWKRKDRQREAEARRG